MTGIQGVVNHFKYIRSNWKAVIAGFVLVTVTAFVVGSLSRAGENALATGYYDTTGNYYESGGSTSPNPTPCYYICPTYPPTPTPTPAPTYTPTPTPSPTSAPTYTPAPTAVPEPRYTCDSLTTTTVDGRTFFFTTQATVANGATIVGYRYDFGDGEVRNGTQTVAHTYNRPGTYLTRSWAQVQVRGQLSWSNLCSRTIAVYASSLPTETPTPTPSPTPTYISSPTPQPTDTSQPTPTSTPTPSAAPVTPPPNNDNGGNGSGGGITNNNNSSATVTINQASTTPVASAAPTVYKSANMAPVSKPTELPKTGPDDFMIKSIGIGTFVASTTMYISSRRELLDTLLRR